MQETMVGAKTITIAWVTDRYQVTPETHVEPGETLVFKNDSEGIVRIQVSSNLPVSEDEFSINGSGSHSVLIKPNAKGTYPFAVFCQARGVFGRGHSMPIIIVDRD